MSRALLYALLSFHEKSTSGLHHGRLKNVFMLTPVDPSKAVIIVQFAVFGFFIFLRNVSCGVLTCSFFLMFLSHV